MVVVALTLGMATTGLLLPRRYRVQRRVTLKRPLEVVWKTIADYSAFPAWRSDVKKILNRGLKLDDYEELRLAGMATTYDRTDEIEAWLTDSGDNTCACYRRRMGHVCVTISA